MGKEKYLLCERSKQLFVPTNLIALHKAFLEAGIQKMTVTEVRDYGNNKSHTEIYRSNVVLY
jgi:nitrogen regulatory protein PII